MNENKTLQAATDVITDASKPFTNLIPPRNLYHKTLQKLGWAKRERVYDVKIIRPGNMTRLASRGIKIPQELFISSALSFLMENAVLYNEDIIYCCAVALQNDRHEPSEELLNIVRYEFSYDLMLSVLQYSVPNIAQSFLSTIVLIKGTSNVLKPEKTSPKE